MKNIFQLLLIVLFSCASQGSPTGGPVDNEGPVILKFSNDIMEKKVSPEPIESIGLLSNAGT